MEAVGAAGAIVGLAGNALTGLKSLGEFISVLQEGKIDLDTMQQRLIEHEFRLSELREEYDSWPNGSMTAAEKDLFDECIKESHEEVKRYKKLLEKAARTRTRGKNFQKVETAVRIYLHEEDFKKHRSLLQDRTLRLQEFSKKTNRVRFHESFQSIMSSAAHYHAEDMTAHTRTVDALQTVSTTIEKNLQQSLSTSSALEAHVTTILGHHNEETQTLIQSSHHSTVHELNESLKQSILPMIQSLFDAAQGSDKSLLRRNERGSAPRRTQNMHHAANDDGVNNKSLAYMQPNSRRVYRTPLGRLHVGYTQKNSGGDSLDRGQIKAAYWVRFDPYGNFSQSFVEWKMFLNTGPSGPPTTIWCNIGTLCEDSEVIDALGLIPEKYGCSHKTTGNDRSAVKHTRACVFYEWRTKFPDHRKLRRLLEERRFSPADYLCDRNGTMRRILTVFVSGHQFCEKPGHTVEIYGPVYRRAICFCDAHRLILDGHLERPDRQTIDLITRKSNGEFQYLSHFYPEYYETLKFLLETGCTPEDDWSDLMQKIADDTCHVMESHARYACTDYFQLNSATKLVRTAVAGSIATECFLPTEYAFTPDLCNRAGEVVGSHRFASVKTHIGNLLPYKNSFQELEDVLFDNGGLAALHDHDKAPYERWLLVLMSYIEPRLKALVASATGSGGKNSVSDISIEGTCEEINKSDHWKKRLVIDYVVYHGNLPLVQLLLQKGFDASLVVDSAARKGNPEIFDFVLEFCLKKERSLSSIGFIHHHRTWLRILKDPAFKTRLLDVLVLQNRHESQEAQIFDRVLINSNDNPFLGDEMTLCELMLTVSAQLPDYIKEVVSGCIFRYEQAQYRFPGGLRLYLLDGLCAQHYFEQFFNLFDKATCHTPCEDLGRSTRFFHQILQQIVSTSVFRCGLEHVPDIELYSETPETEGYTPLMLALHGGMIPAVRILIDAGADLTSYSRCGLSALQLAEQNAQSKHPRIFRNGRNIHARISRPGYSVGFQQVSAVADHEMLEMLHDTLRRRGEEVSEPYLHHSAFVKTSPLWIFKPVQRGVERIEPFLYWLFSPTVRINMEELREHLTYLAVVLVFGLLSIVKLFQLNIEGFTAGTMKLISRPIVIIPLAAWAVQLIWRGWRQDVTEPEWS
ncbi:hypothetical protein PFICI_09132 [Pestalotiopsis fici W106-1]|uniref:Uncharacterized protein n=1 Tax=Pestalotiopsis fici (strain W106-1 / CGMCC3.15140) TaxID=1229662 RepID=W3WZU1_PESFW|nr:uncharacterized protein PFICI_09132 [Pestalotiopsis fici W106-1]ETS79279.1 hypothetical protein PFICI_09132 [Pestalotiopsis fici W106-1]